LYNYKFCRYFYYKGDKIIIWIFQKTSFLFIFFFSLYLTFSSFYTWAIYHKLFCYLHFLEIFSSSFLYTYLPIGHASQSNADRFRIGWERRRPEKRDIASPSGDQNLGFLSGGSKHEKIPRLKFMTMLSSTMKPSQGTKELSLMFYIYRIVCKWAGKSSGDGSAFVLL
jgi:hypothetical protein